MHPTYTQADYTAAVTDSGTAQRGLGLADGRHWANLGCSDQALWGECAGSGAKPYLVAIDRAGPAFKCSCPSRVFPCKHGAGLMALVVRSPELLPAAPEPAWVADWLAKRHDKPEPKPKREEQAAPSPKPPSEAADATRMKRMAGGVADFERWLIDVMRMGLAALDGQPPAAWEGRAAQLVDAQLPGLAANVRALAQERGADRPARLLARLGEMYLLTQAFAWLETLPDNARAEVLQQLGVSLRREDVLAAQPPIPDTWLVMGQATALEERLTVRRIWLQGQGTGRYALLLDYAFGSQGFATTYLPRHSYAGALHFYPSLYPLRALTGDGFELSPQEQAHILPIILGQALTDYAHALAANPWLRAFPMHLRDMVPELHKGGWHLRHEGRLLPMRCPDETGWQMAAESGGHPLTVFGEWDGSAFMPLSHHLQNQEQPATL